ncbi:MAG: hypothetical protein IRZ15_06275 [Bryobacteraceae bacterium]|jgi:hypothetical protein|nr:hypothetical protein [Bryobacteraceae bacterium]
MRTKLAVALALYGVLALLASFTLTGGLRLAILVLLAGLAVKTWVGFRLNS